MEIENPIKKPLLDLITNHVEDTRMVLKPYQTRWLEIEG
jgi:hypothetical protein